MARPRKSAAADAEALAKKEAARVRYWLSEIEAAKRREKDWRAKGKEILETYEGERREETPFNILFSNTETLFPALYSSVPRPVVERRFKDDDPVGKMAADAGRRCLEFLLDTNVEGYETFDQGMRAAVLDALLPGRGVTAIKYDADIGVLDAGLSDTTHDEEEEGEKDEEAEVSEYKASELICLDAKLWNRVVIGPAKKWSKVPWVAYEEEIDREEAERLFGDEVAALLQYGQREEGESQKKSNEDEGQRKTALVYQVWHKAKKQVIFVSDGYKTGPLKVLDDPLQLTGFYNIPKPLCFIEKSNNLAPTALYALYENQAKELNTLTVRINNIAKAIKARGVYDSSLGTDVKNLMDAMDNELVPTDSASSLAAEKGLQNAIWFMPLDTLIVTLRELMAAREAVKQTIYEIMGIADIMRGASNASETLGAQQIKQNWGNLRLKRIQKEVQRYARDLLRMALELAANKFSPDTWKKMTGLPFPLAEEKERAKAALQQWQASQPPPQQGQPPAQPDPQMVQAAQLPSWDEILAVLRDDTQRAYRIDIETNSTVEPEAAEDQKNIQELMGALGQFLNGMGPLVKEGVMPFQAAQSMLLAITRRYRFGTDIEDQIKSMKEPKQADPNAAEQAKAIADAKKHEMTIAAQREAEQMRAQAQERATQAQMAADERRAQLDAQREAAKEAEITRREEIAAQTERFRLEKEAQAKKDIARNQSLIDRETELEKVKLQVAGQIEIARINAGAKKYDSEMKALTASAGAEQSGDGGDGVPSAEQAGEETSVIAKILAGQEKMVSMLAQQSDGHAKATAQLIESINKPKRRRAVRDASGRIDYSEEF